MLKNSHFTKLRHFFTQHLDNITNTNSELRLILKKYIHNKKKKTKTNGGMKYQIDLLILFIW